VEITRRKALWILLGAVVLFWVRLSPDVWTQMRGNEEAHYCSVAARVVADGGPLYGNALGIYGPVTYWIVAGVFRICGLYNMPAARIAEAMWFGATAVVLYAAGRVMMGRAASLAAAGAFLLTALHPGFQEIRGEPFTALPLAAAAGLCSWGAARRRPVGFALAGAAVGVAFLTKQPAGVALPAVAACPLMAWWWRRREESLWRGALGAGLAVAGFAALVGGVWLWYVVRGAGHEFFYCVWSYNWAFVRQCPAGGFTPSAGFVWGRLARYADNVPLLAVGVMGAVAGLAWRGLEEREASHLAWRAWVTTLVLMLGAMLVAACPANIPVMPLNRYIPYKSFLYAPMCLLAGVCVEVAVRAQRGGRLFWAVLAAVGFAYFAIPATRPVESAALRVSMYASAFGVGRIAATAALLSAAGWLLGGRAGALAAPLTYAAVYLAAPASLGVEGTHLAAAGGLVALGLLRVGWDRRSLAIAALAGGVHAAARIEASAPQLGLAMGAVAWLLLQRRASLGERLATAGVYGLCVVPVSVAFMGFDAAPYSFVSVSDWWGSVEQWLLPARLGASLACAGAVVLALRGRRALAEHPLGLLLCAAAGALGGGVVHRLDPAFLASAGMALATGAAVAVARLLSRDAAPPTDRARVLLGSSCAVAGACALALGFKAPIEEPPGEPYARFARAMEPGARAYVWGRVFDTELYLRARAVPAVPQLGMWLLEGTGPPPIGKGLHARPAAARLEGLDTDLCQALPRHVIIMKEPTPTPADLPRFGQVLRERYGVTLSHPSGVLYTRRDGSPRPR